jgi:hypothetical protein
MRIHAVIDDELFRLAEDAFPGVRSKTALLEEALRALVERSAARDLARMLRHHPVDLTEVPRRRAGADAS